MSLADEALAALKEELALIHSTIATFGTPRDALRRLIDWHILVERDPKVSKISRDAELYNQMQEVALANGFSSITEAITVARTKSES